jgi:hypothetical protein
MKIKDRIKAEDKEKPLRYKDIFLRPLRERWEVAPGVFAELLETKKEAIFLRLEIAKGKVILLCPDKDRKEVALFSGDVMETRTKKSLKIVKNILINPHKRNALQALEDSVLYAYLDIKK